MTASEQATLATLAAEAKARADAATPGEWEIGPAPPTPTSFAVWAGGEQMAYVFGRIGFDASAIAAFIAHARQDVPALADGVAQQAAYIAELEGLLHDMWQDGLAAIREAGRQAGLAEAKGIVRGMAGLALAGSNWNTEIVLLSAADMIAQAAGRAAP